jgi:hypothetical protein
MTVILLMLMGKSGSYWFGVAFPCIGSDRRNRWDVRLQFCDKPEDVIESAGLAGRSSVYVSLDFESPRRLSRPSNSSLMTPYIYARRCSSFVYARCAKWIINQVPKAKTLAE